MILNPRVAAIFHRPQEELQFTFTLCIQSTEHSSYSHVSQLILLLQVIQSKAVVRAPSTRATTEKRGLRLAAPALSCIFQEQAEKKILPFKKRKRKRKKIGLFQPGGVNVSNTASSADPKSPHCSSECEHL